MWLADCHKSSRYLTINHPLKGQLSHQKNEAKIIVLFHEEQVKF